MSAGCRGGAVDQHTGFGLVSLCGPGDSSCLLGSSAVGPILWDSFLLAVLGLEWLI